VHWATTAAAAGLPSWLIKVMGWWSSDTYQTYLRLPTLMQCNSHCGSLTTLSNQYYKVSRLYPVLYAMHAYPRYHILSISPQPFAWAVHMMYNATVHTKGCLATYYFCYYLCIAVHCCHFCLCCTLPMPLFAYAVCWHQNLYLMYIAGAIATIVHTVCCCHCYCHCHHLYCTLLLSFAFSVCCCCHCLFCMLILPLHVLYITAAIACVIYIYYLIQNSPAEKKGVVPKRP